MDAKRYNNVKLAIGIIKGIASFLLILLFVISGLSNSLQHLLEGYFSNKYLIFIAFIMVTGAAAGIIFFPVNYYPSFTLNTSIIYQTRLFSNGYGRILKPCWFPA